MKYKLNGYDKNDIPFECSGTIERPIDPPVCPTNPDSVIGTEGNNGWYKSDVTIKFNGHNSVKEYYWVTRHNNKISDPIKNKNLEIKVEGTTSYMLYVSNGYKTISCGGWKDIKIDKTAPKFKGADYNIYIKQTSSAQKGVGYVYLAGYLTTRNICMKNTSGYIHFDIPNPIYEDSISGVAHYTIENLLSTDPNVFSRPNTPKTYRIKYSAEDNAGNVSGISYSDTFTVAYILNSSSNQSYSPCYLGNYKNIFKTDGFIDDGKNYNLNASS